MDALTAEQIIDRARIRHFSFGAVSLPDGAVVAYLDDLQRRVLLRIIEATEALVGTTSQVDTSNTQTLVALDDFGVPYFATTVETAYALKFSGGVPYIDTSTPFIVDPFGSEGSTPGFPLPTDILRLMGVTAIASGRPVGSQPLEVNIVEERFADARGGSLQLRAFVSASRLVPVRIADTDLWSTVTALLFSIVRCPQLQALSDAVTLPIPYCGVLVAGAAALLAGATEKCPQSERTAIRAEFAELLKELDVIAASVLDAVTQNGVIYRG